MPGPSLDDAKKMLRLAIATGLNFDVQYPTIEEVLQYNTHPIPQSC